MTRDKEYVYKYTTFDDYKGSFTLKRQVSDDQARRIAEIIHENDLRVSYVQLQVEGE